MPSTTSSDPAFNPYSAELDELDARLRQIVDAIRFRRPTLLDEDDYGRAVTRLTEAVIDYTAARRSAGTACAKPAVSLRRSA